MNSLRFSISISVLLPATHRDAILKNQQLNEAVAQGGRMAVKTALIIDDEPDVTTYHGTVLSDHGWEVYTANSGADGIASHRKRLRM